jgi:hypothetical protein
LATAIPQALARWQHERRLDVAGPERLARGSIGVLRKP